MGKIINNIILIISIAIFGFCGYIYFTNSENPQKAFVMGYKPVFAVRETMAPTINKYDVVILKKYNGQDLKNEDLIFYQLDNSLEVIHRVKGSTSEGYITKSDSSRKNDDYIVKKDQILGTAVAILNTSFLVKNYIICGIALLVIFQAWIFISIYRRKKKAAAESDKLSSEKRGGRRRANERIKTVSP